MTIRPRRRLAQTDKAEWTLMFFLGSDTADLSPLMVSQLKDIKDAGFQLNTNVLVHFDPNVLGAPTRILNVNGGRKIALAKSRIGDGADPFIPCVGEDNIDLKAMKALRGAAAKKLTKRVEADEDDKTTSDEALETFLDLCRENFPANHYALFLIGHGLIVGNDAFLPDDNPVSSITLRRLGQILRRFGNAVRKVRSEFELIAMHSCCMSAVEVAYQLKDTANYMMGTEGIAFINSWPYRQLLKKTFDAVEKRERQMKRAAAKGAYQANGDSEFVPDLVKKLYALALHNATDFMLAGYSADLSLCRLRAAEVEKLTTPIKNLVAQLKRGLDDKRVQQLILLAHWKSQSYWQENYTDLVDFCKCLAEASAGDPPGGQRAEREELKKGIAEACKAVKAAVEEVVVHSDHFGSQYQYSHGLSIFFPWSRPKDVNDHVMEKYKGYAFSKELGDDSWLTFLEDYFKKTQRLPRHVEDHHGKKVKVGVRLPGFEAARQHFNPVGALGDGGPAPIKESPSLLKESPSVGVGCDCASIKNFPDETRERLPNRKGKRLRVRAFSISEKARKCFGEE
jgi:Clostripain family